MGRPAKYPEELERVLNEEDGPTLRYALQGLHREQIHLPSRGAARPDNDLLEERYEAFRTWR